MTAAQLRRRFIARFTSAESTGAMDPKTIDPHRWDEMLEDVAEIRNQSPAKLVRIDHRSSMAIDELRARVRLYVRILGTRLVVVDYLQLVRGPGKELRLQVAAVVEGLRRLAKDEGIGVIALSQLSRSDHELPTLARLKETGEIENAAHTVLLIHRPVSALGIQTGADQIIIAKQGRGATGAINVSLDLRHMQFVER